MKKIVTILFIFLVSLPIYTGCSQYPSIGLVDIHATIVTDQSKTGYIMIKKDNEEREIVPTSLYYDISLKNTGNRSINTTDNLKLTIEPRANLRSEAFQLVGNDIFMIDNGGFKIAPLPLKSNETLHAALYYHLGTYQKGSYFPDFPTIEQTEQLLQHATDADLVIYLNEEEIARFDLSE